MNLADNLKRIRKDNNLSQEQLAEKLGVSRQSVSKWESGQSYPEMDKVLQICSLFNLNINELINENIKEINEIKEAKNISNKYITSFFDYLTKVVDMFSSMKLKQIIGCLFEQFIIFILLFIVFSIIGSIGYGLIQGILRQILPYNLYVFLISILEIIFLLISSVLGVAILLHIFKIRYLDYYEFVKVDKKSTNKGVDLSLENDDVNEVSNEDEVEKEEKTKQKIILEKKPEKVIIRDPKHSDFKFLSGLGKIILMIVKFFVAWILLFFAMGFVGLVVCLVIGFLFVKTGVLFVGYLLAMLGGLAICAICIELLFNFIFSRKNSTTRYFITGIISLIAVGIGSGMILIGISEFNITSDNSDTIKEEYIVEMKDNLMIARYYNYYHTVDYVVEDRDDIKIEVEHSKYSVTEYDEEGGLVYIYDYVADGEAMNILRRFIKDFNEKKIIDYSGSPVITVYASKENIEKMKNNRKDYYDDKNKIVEELNKYKNEVNRLYVEADRLESILDSNGYVVVRDSNDRILEIYKEKNYDDEE